MFAPSITPASPARVPGCWMFFSGNLVIGIACIAPIFVMMFAWLTANSGHGPLLMEILPDLVGLFPLAAFVKLVGRGLCFPWYRSVRVVGLAIGLVTVELLLMVDQYLLDTPLALGLLLLVVYAALDGVMFYCCGLKVPRPLTGYVRTSVMLVVLPVMYSIWIYCAWSTLSPISSTILCNMAIGLCLGWIFGRGIAYICLAFMGRPK